MKSTIRILLIVTVFWIVGIWYVLPAAFNAYWGRSAMIRFDPRISRDYNCIFVEGHEARHFGVAWLARPAPVQYLRIRFTPLSDDQPYGIMFVDPQTLAYRAYAGWAASPDGLAGRLDSPQIILDWLHSQPHSHPAESETNDAREIYGAIRVLAPLDMDHFALPANYPMKNFVVVFQSPARSDFPRWNELISLALLWMAGIAGGRRKLKEGNRM